MALEVERLGSVAEANRNQWNNVVEQSELGCVYHRYEWLRAVEEGIGHEPHHLLVSKKGNPVAVFPNFVTDLGRVKRLSSIRPGYGGPVTMTDEEDALEMLLDAVGDVCRGTVLYNELRVYDQNYVRYNHFLESKGYQPTILSCRFTLDLTRGWDALFSEMDSERRRGIRRGHDYEFEVVDEAISEENCVAFYEDYATVADRVGLPTHPLAFFRELPRLEDRLKLFTLEVDGEARGQYMYLLDEEQSTLQHLFTGVTEDQFEYHAPELLHEHAIKWGIDEGYETYELRGSPPDFRNGVFRFKEYFGAETIPLLVYERGRPAPALSVLNVGRSLTRRLEP
ncbi:lipid II:glycine glycyltransferase FemX [Natronobacterium texcoconense]|uniref:Acetyltransferase (GNAT) domain-containing protein n=1 Tax=Natronobacterium texcoconense TaxID=1095778 RepID=A0A1H0Z663_NATTX|nr:GNAT family N-acetyltransferase [Natronobacterium texcoconense]SDQ22977.1 Acetyltransferase (GNAT) domain-containing protein [Natronobacterium texcoconense]